MKALGYIDYSLIGWSDGGISSLILAARHSGNIRKMIVFGSNCYILPEELKVYQSMIIIDYTKNNSKILISFIFNH